MINQYPTKANGSTMKAVQMKRHCQAMCLPGFAKPDEKTITKKSIWRGLA
jgi:hypothetical protein